MAPAAAAASASSSSRRAQWRRLLREALEAWTHQLLFQRHVYPPESFVPARCGGVACRRSRHPGVRTYVRRAVAVATEALGSGGATAMRLTLAIVLDAAAAATTATEAAPSARGAGLLGDDHRDATVARELERYEIELALTDSPEWEQDASSADVEALARALRGLLLQVLSQVPRDPVSESEALSFRLALALPHGTAAPTARVERFLWDDCGSGLYKLRFTMAQGGPA